MAGRDILTKQEPSSGPGFAYLMTGIAIGCIVVSGVFGSIFTPDLVSTSGAAIGYTRQHTPLAAYMGWIFDLIAIAMVLPAAMQGIRAKVTDRLAWMLLGLGVGGIWLAVMFVSVFAPVMVTGTAPWQTWVPLGSILAVIAGLILTGFLCKFVKTTFFQPGEAQPRSEMTIPMVGPEPTTDDVTTMLRHLAQLRDSGLITEADFQTKKDELLSRIS